MSTKLKIIILLLFLVQGAVFYWTYSDKEQVEKERLKPFQTYLKNPLAVKTLELSNLKLEELPIDFSQFQNLEYLDLSNNRFDEIPKELFGLPKLKVLNLSYNQLSVVERLEPMMAKLVLNNNQIDRLSFRYKKGEEPKLKYINLSNNQFDKIPDLRKTKIDTIIAAGNLFEDFTRSQAKLPNNHQVKYLDLSNNNRLYYYISSMNELPFRCASLNLSYNEKMKFPYDLFQRNGILKKLYLKQNYFQEKFNLLPTNNIEQLDLENTIIFFDNKSPFQTCLNLKELNVSGVNTYGLMLSNSDLEYLSVEFMNQKELNLPNLKTISLDASLSLVKLVDMKDKFPNLENIILRNYNHDDGMLQSELATDFPNIKITIESFAIEIID